MTTTHDIVAKLWNLCHVLRDDGITYHQYATELTYLLFLKMAQETGTDDQLPDGYRWSDVVERDGLDQLDFYRLLLIHLGANGSQRVQDIYANAQTSLRQPKNLAKLVSSIDALDWYGVERDQLGDLYEGLLEKNAGETKSGAGQYFTPRVLIDVMVRLMKPQPGERIQDPAAGTLGFIVAAHEYIKAHHDVFEMKAAEYEFQTTKAYEAVELVPDTRRLALMNGMLHGLATPVHLGDALAPLGTTLPKADLILTNPPFGTKKGGGRPTRDDFTFPTSNKQLAFLQHIYRGLKPGGRAAVVLPDNVLFEDNTGQQIRADLMDKCNLHTILRLPTGIFYAQGVKTNVLFFTRGETDSGNTKNVWIYDLRTNMPKFGKRTPLTKEHFAEFEACFGGESDGTAVREATGEDSRWRVFSRADVEKRGDNLDITWLRDDSVERAEDLPEPEEIAAEIMVNLRTAMEEMEGLMELLEGPGAAE